MATRFSKKKKKNILGQAENSPLQVSLVLDKWLKKKVSPALLTNLALHLQAALNILSLSYLLSPVLKIHVVQVSDSNCHILTIYFSPAYVVSSGYFPTSVFNLYLILKPNCPFTVSRMLLPYSANSLSSDEVNWTNLKMVSIQIQVFSIFKIQKKLENSKVMTNLKH